MSWFKRASHQDEHPERDAYYQLIVDRVPNTAAYCAECGVEISSGTYCSDCDPEHGSQAVSLTLIWCTDCGCYVEAGHTHEEQIGGEDYCYCGECKGYLPCSSGPHPHK